MSAIESSTRYNQKNKMSTSADHKQAEQQALLSLLENSLEYQLKDRETFRIRVDVRLFRDGGERNPVDLLITLSRSEAEVKPISFLLQEIENRYVEWAKANDKTTTAIKSRKLRVGSYECNQDDVISSVLDTGGSVYVTFTCENTEEWTKQQEKKKEEKKNKVSKKKVQSQPSSDGEDDSDQENKDQNKSKEVYLDIEDIVHPLTGQKVGEKKWLQFRDRYSNLCENLKSMTRGLRDEFYKKEPRILVNQLIPYYRQFLEESDPYRKDVLKPLMKILNVEFEEAKDRAEAMLKDGEISYDFLWYVFHKGLKVVSEKKNVSYGGITEQASYNHGFWSRYFKIQVEVIQCNGSEFYRSEEDFEIHPFEGTKKLENLPVRPIDPETEARLIERGRRFALWGKDPSYLSYQGCVSVNSWYSTKSYKADGRVMIDGRQFNRINPDYPTWRYEPDDGQIIKVIPDDRLFTTWPTLGGFSFSAKKWGEIYLDHCQDIQFDDTAYDSLVLPQEEKELIRALVENSDSSFADIISGKGAGCIFLLHGPPGVGKTLTAESIAELLHRPLYSVSVGELGTDTDELEKRLREILDVASSWNAVILIDEADIFLEQRSENEIVRNAMVGVFLRLLEYHQGVLFLTTNRVGCFDEAFKSRISVALQYPMLDRSARSKIWTNLLKAAQIDQSTLGISVDDLANHELNGRQIRTIIRLAQTLAKRASMSISANHLDRVIQITTKFEADILAVKQRTPLTVNSVEISQDQATAV